MVINKKTNKINKFFILQVIYFSLKFVGTVFVSSSKINKKIVPTHPFNPFFYSFYWLEKLLNNS